MSAFSNYLEQALINGTLRGTTFTAPSTVYLALYSTDPTDADSGTEVSGGAYARQAITFAAPSNGVTSNSADVPFPIATGGYTASHWGVRDASSGGNLLYHGALTASRTVVTGDQLVARAGEITVTLA